MNSQMRLLFLLVCLMTVKAFAQAPLLPERDVSLEWETIEGASTYDIEVSRKPKGNYNAEIHTTTEALWKGRLSPGYYQMRIRAKDRRKVPGEWSEAVEMTVLLEPPKSNDLKSQLRLDSKDPESFKFGFRWLPVPGADGYTLKIEGSDGKVLQELASSTPTIDVELPVAQEIKWTLLGKNAEGLVSETPLQGKVEVWGPALEKPEIEAPATAYVRDVKWQSAPFAQDAHYTLQIKDPKSNKWKSVDTNKNFIGNTLKFAPAWPGGQYRLNVRSQATLRKPSKVSSLQFSVVDGDRSEEAEYTAMLRQSIVRTTGWFVTGSYLVTAMQYTGINADNGGGAPLQVELPNNFGGTGRLGLGWISDRRPWGFQGIMDMSGFIVAGRNPTFATIEANAIRRTVVGQNGEFRQHAGLFYKELPEIIAKDLTGIDRIEKIVAAGPHYGFEYWWALSPKLGFQVNGHLYGSLISVKTPTGNPVSTSLSYQAGLLGSYRISPRASGLIGYAYRQDSQAYQSSTDRKNTVKITGHYLNLFLEWAL